MLRLAKKKRLPFIPHNIGRWWGANPKTKKQDDIDILALNKNGDSAIFCEGKFKNSAFDMKEYDDLICASQVFTKPEKRYYYLFSKGGYTKAVRERAVKDGTVLVSVDDLFNDI